MPNKKPYIPTQEEIRRKCLEYQAGWTRKQEQQRCVSGYRRIHAFTKLVPSQEQLLSEYDR
jgi:hypothetical protein